MRDVTAKSLRATALTVSKSVYFDDGKRRLKVLATLDVGLTEAVDRDRRSQP